MTWQTEITSQVRALIGDMDVPYTYADVRLNLLEIAATVQVLQEIDFSTAYSVDITAQSITPDPTTLTPKDNNFMNLVSLKSAILLYTGELRKYALSGMVVTDGPSTINMGGVYNSMKANLLTLQTQYEKAKVLYQTGQIGQAVMTPYTTINVYPIQDF